MRRAAGTLGLAAVATGALTLVAPRLSLGATEPPFRLIETIPVAGFGRGLDPAAVAPDASGLAFPDNRTRTLAVVDLRTGGRTSGPYSGSVSAFTPVHNTVPLAAWSRDGSLLWSVSRVLAPGGFAKTALEPVRIARTGTVSALPPLRSPSGPLDAIEWVGPDGLALAQFGTAGDYYKPDHDDPAPELAMVDAAHGRMLDRLPLTRLAAFRARKPGFSARVAIGWASGMAKPNGRLSALVAVNGGPGHRVLVYWQQGAPPSELPHPAPDEQWTRGALLPSGDRFLLTRQLKPDGDDLICEIWSSNCARVPPPTPRTGPLLQLRDVRAGKVVWTLDATADRFWDGHVLAVAPDSRFALVSYPPAGNIAQVAVVRISDGRLMQRLPLPAGEAGFADGGRTIWVRGNGAILLYRRG